MTSRRLWRAFFGVSAAAAGRDLHQCCSGAMSMLTTHTPHGTQKNRQAFASAGGAVAVANSGPLASAYASGPRAGGVYTGSYYCGAFVSVLFFFARAGRWDAKAKMKKKSPRARARTHPNTHTHLVQPPPQQQQQQTRLLGVWQLRRLWQRGGGEFVACPLLHRRRGDGGRLQFSAQHSHIHLRPHSRHAPPPRTQHTLQTKKAGGFYG